MTFVLTPPALKPFSIGYTPSSFSMPSCVSNGVSSKLLRSGVILNQALRDWNETEIKLHGSQTELEAKTHVSDDL